MEAMDTRDTRALTQNQFKNIKYAQKILYEMKPYPNNSPPPFLQDLDRNDF